MFSVFKTVVSKFLSFVYVSSRIVKAFLLSPHWAKAAFQFTFIK
jgi:hypothetical protein